MAFHPNLAIRPLLKTVLKKEIFIMTLLDSYLRENYLASGVNNVSRNHNPESPSFQVNSAAARLLLSIFPLMDSGEVGVL